MIIPDLHTIRHKMDQAPKQQSKKYIQKAMQKQSKGIGISTRKIKGHSSIEKIHISESTTDG
jgi:hypothetical protein